MTNESVYSKWKIMKWPTPMSAFVNPRLESLKDGIQLEIVIQNFTHGDQRPKVEFVFSGIYSYRNINKGFRTSLWEVVPLSNLGATWMVQNSDFLDLLKADVQGAATFRDARHFVIATENDVIEIVACAPPRMRLLTEGDVRDEESQIVEIR